MPDETMTGPRCVWPLEAELGEGPIWIEEDAAVWFVDIKRRRIHSYTTTTEETRSWEAPAQPGFLAPRAGGGFLCGLQTGLHAFDADTGGFTLVAEVEADRPGNRLNDGAVDGQGALWFGSMDDAEQAPTGCLYRYTSADGVKLRDPGYVITNGPAMSPDGRTLYHVDTLERTIYAFDHAGGELSRKRPFARVDRPGAYADGIVVDCEGHIWLALWGGWGLQRFAPDGELVQTLDLPCANVTKACFGGPDLKTLYVTTARKGLSPSELARQPLAGGLFQVDVGVGGLAQGAVR
jgi:xylono-1,5-lactonase